MYLNVSLCVGTAQRLEAPNPLELELLAAWHRF